MSDGLHFECTACGKCCTTRGEYAHVYLDGDEVRALARLLGIKTRELKKRYTFKDEYGWTQLRFETDHCVFLDPETQHCKVYEARPVQCRTFPFWRDMVAGEQWTAEAREMCEGLGRGPLWSAAEIEARMADFEKSDDE